MSTDDDRTRYLEVYLRDHRAGAEAGVSLAERCRDHAPDAATTAIVAGVLADIEQDRDALDAVMDGLGIEPSSLKALAATAAERLGRLKLNGRLVRSSPLSVVVELESLIGAVSVKRELWATLSVLAAGGHGPAQPMERLLERAEDQRARLRALHDRVVREAFPPADPSVPTPAPGDGRPAGDGT